MILAILRYSDLHAANLPIAVDAWCEQALKAATRRLLFTGSDYRTLGLVEERRGDPWEGGGVLPATTWTTTFKAPSHQASTSTDGYVPQHFRRHATSMLSVHKPITFTHGRHW